MTVLLGYVLIGLVSLLLYAWTWVIDRVLDRAERSSNVVQFPGGRR